MRRICYTTDEGAGGTPPEQPEGGAPAAETPAPAPPPAPAPSPEWNGELESLAKETWFTSLPDDVRPVLEAGLRQKHSNWQSGFQSKIRTEQQAARASAEATVRAEYDAKVTAAEQRAAAAERKAANFSEWFGEGSEGDHQAKAELEKATAELARLKALEEEFTTGKTAWEQERDRLAAEKAAAEAERDEHKTWRTTREQADQEREVARYVEENTDLLDDADASEMLQTMIEKQGMDADEAATKLRKLLKKHNLTPGAQPAAPVAEVAPAPVPVAAPAPAAPAKPDAIDLMSAGDSSNGGFKLAPEGMDLYKAAEIAWKNRRVQSG